MGKIAKQKLRFLDFVERIKNPPNGLRGGVKQGKRDYIPSPKIQMESKPNAPIIEQITVTFALSSGVISTGRFAKRDLWPGLTCLFFIK